jgi:hypothetical protein
VANTYVLVKLPSYNPTQGYIIEVYNDAEIASLKEHNRWDVADQAILPEDEDSSSGSSDEEEIRQPVTDFDAI